jgi:RNA-directed DNA polymerase
MTSTAKYLDFVLKKKIAYTRYCDDMAFSTHDIKMRGEILKKVKSVLKSQPFPKLKMNNKKTVFGSKAHRRILTGLIIANNGTVSLGRDRKRRIRAQIHHLMHGKLTDKEKSTLQGMLAFARDIEPDFVERMEKKYGQQVIKNL